MTDGGHGDAAGSGSGSGAGPWLAPWTHRKAVTLLASAIEAPLDGALSNFPVMITLDDPELQAGLLADASDLAVTAADATTLLDHEVESYTAGARVAWIRIPALPATTDTTIYLYYGNATPPAPNPAATWGADFLAVYHLQQDPGLGAAGDMRDATAHHHDGTAGTSMSTTDSVAGQVGRALQFAGGGDYIAVPTLDLGNAFTISMWMNMQSVSGIHSLLSNSPDNSDTDGIRFFVNTDNSSDRSIHVETGNGSSSAAAITPYNVVTTGQWTHVAAVVDRTNGQASIVVDGQLANPGSQTILTSFRTASNLEIARMMTNNPFPGVLDEIEIATALRPIEWLRTAFHDQGDPSSFYRLGPEETR
jgi:MSHA biogenesis protein MshQ